MHGPQRVEVKATATTPEQPGQRAVDPDRAAKVPAQVMDANGNAPISQTAADSTRGSNRGARKTGACTAGVESVGDEPHEAAVSLKSRLRGPPSGS